MPLGGTLLDAGVLAQLGTGDVDLEDAVGRGLTAEDWLVAGAAKVASEIETGTIVFVICDYGWKYISTGAWTDDLDEVVERAEKIIYF